MKPAQISRVMIPPASWSDVPWGEYYREALSYHLAEWWPKAFGYNLLKVGGLSTEIDTDKCNIPHQICLATDLNDVQVIADAHQLPFIHKSIDACLLAHTLSYSADPHAILREVDRVLVDDGWLILSNFNPFSLVGLGSLLPWLNRRPPYDSRMFPLMRLLDWLQLLNYEIVAQSCFQVLPAGRGSAGFLETHLPALGSLSLIIARKRTIPLIRTPQSLRSKAKNWQHVVGATKSYPANQSETTQDT